MWTRWGAMALEELGPYDHVAILDVCQPLEHVAAVGIPFHRRQGAIQEGSVGLVLPMVAEGLEIGGDSRGHEGKLSPAYSPRRPGTVGGNPRGTPS